MTFTKDVPKVEGIYLWRNSESSSGQPCWVIRGDDGKLWRDGRWVATFGEWCRLIPADEIGKTWMECAETYGHEYPSTEVSFSMSRAKRVMEGME